ncbi:type 1 glutamine amidotransferase domain-containing protein [Bacillus pumilus]|jgi:protease I|uniref:type 1 glutamine amidotransferase domain-containing protein n=1 Tax=Bacillus pumilus TaxID=1408 RepID=UPI00081FAB44|nr:type 1 glutamine amidotransferase domain-containing protein [Bacillus pumilus]AOC57484.1 protease [Bacillus pumilus]MBR0588269.1 type 1 glutamine amidotransferase [Bacillus pumilus DW2J2]MBR0616540.1 type 1 glutamine amidotransferase [Bacillus pumilus]MBR0625669.1 type 1 glutamine amidotransferase [Bacillus pumilus]MCY7725361.1 type 1 glutamine amidotransferase [Bacillus pumilus]
MGKKIAVVLTDYFEDVEFTEPAKAFKDAGHEITVIENEKGKTVKGKQGDAEVRVDASIDHVKPEDFDALLIPGGFSPDILRADDRYVQFTKTFMDEKKPVFAICHGPQLLITAKTLEGRGATGYTSIQVDMENAGAKFKDEEVVVCQDQLVTSRTPDDISAFNRESLKLLEK